MNIRIISALPVVEEVGPQKVCADSDDDLHFFGLYEDDGPISEEWMVVFRKLANEAFARKRLSSA